MHRRECKWSLATVAVFAALAAGCSRTNQIIEPPVDPLTLVDQIDPAVRYVAAVQSPEDLENARKHQQFIGDLAETASINQFDFLEGVYYDLSHHVHKRDLYADARLAKLHETIQAIVESKKALVSSAVGAGEPYDRIRVPDVLAHMAVSKLNFGDPKGFEADIALTNRWAAGLLDARGSRGVFALALDILRSSDSAVLATCQWDGISEATARSLYKQLPPLDRLLDDYKNVLKRDVRDRLMGIAATATLRVGPSRGHIDDPTAAMVAVRKHPHPFDRRKTAKLFSVAVKEVIEKLSCDELEPEYIKNPDYAIDWDPLLRLRGSDLPASDDIDASQGRITKLQLQRQEKALKTVDNPYGRFLVARTVGPLASTSQIGDVIALRNAVRVALAARVFRIKHQRNMTAIDELNKDGVLDKIPLSPFDHTPYTFNSKLNTLLCSRPNPRGIRNVRKSEAAIAWQMQRTTPREPPRILTPSQQKVMQKIGGPPHGW